MDEQFLKSIGMTNEEIANTFISASKEKVLKIFEEETLNSPKMESWPQEVKDFVKGCFEAGWEGCKIAFEETFDMTIKPEIEEEVYKKILEMLTQLENQDNNE